MYYSKVLFFAKSGIEVFQKHINHRWPLTKCVSLYISFDIHCKKTFLLTKFFQSSLGRHKEKELTILYYRTAPDQSQGFEQRLGTVPWIRIVTFCRTNPDPPTTLSWIRITCLPSVWQEYKVTATLTLTVVFVLRRMLSWNPNWRTFSIKSWRIFSLICTEKTSAISKVFL